MHHYAIGRPTGRQGVPYKNYCRSFPEVKEEESVKHKALRRKRLTAIGILEVNYI